MHQVANAATRLVAEIILFEVRYEAFLGTAADVANRLVSQFLIHQVGCEQVRLF